MDSDPANADPEMDRVIRRLERIEHRLDALERRAPTVTREYDETTDDGSTTAWSGGTTDLLPLLGRTLVVVGGAFVLRAITESGMLSPALGSALALVYAVAWLVMADRAAAKGAEGSAIWHVVAGTIIAFPLLWETTAEFGFLSPRLAAIVLGFITAAGLVVAWRSRLAWVAWIVTLASVVTLLSLAMATRQPVLFASLLLVIGLATLWISYVRGWRGLAWLIAVPADLLVGLLTAVALIADPERSAELLQPASLIALQLALVIVYVGSFVVRALVARDDVGGLEITQGLAAVTIGVGGAIAVARSHPAAWVPLGLVSAALGAAGYAVSFSLLDRTARRANFIFYSSLALLFTLVAVTSLMPASIVAIVLAAGAVVMAWAGARAERATLSLHGAVYATGAGISSGLLSGSVRTLTATGPLSFDWIGPAAIAALGGAVAYCAFPVAEHGRTWGQASRIPKLLVLSIALVGIAGLLFASISGTLPHEGDAVDPAALAILRTAVLAFAAVALAWLGRYPRVAQAAWLVYPVLVVGGLKLVLEDLRVAGPAILVASFALYGGALILAPRLMRNQVARVSNAPAP